METSLLSDLARQGLMGLLLAITLTVAFVLGRLLLIEKDKRIEDANRVTDNIVGPLNNIKDNLQALLGRRDK